MAELYLFTNEGNNYAYSPTLFSKTLSGITYLPAIVTRSNITLTDNLAKSPVTFKFERTHSFAKSLVNNIPETPIIVTIYKDSQTYWQGRVLSAKMNNLFIEISCDSVYTTLNREALTNRFTLGCRHTLYSPSCGVVNSSWDSLYNVVGLNSTVLTIPGIVETSGYFSKGIAGINGQKRHIIDHTNTAITLSQPFDGIQSGILHLYPGCQFTEESCAAFNNLLNFGGFSRIPSKNPYGSTGIL